MAIDRRTVLTGMAAGLAVPLPSQTAFGARSVAGSAAFLSTAKLPNGYFAAIALGVNGNEVWRNPLPGRGHDCAIHPNRPIAVFFDRRPGCVATVLDAVAGRTLLQFRCPKDRSLCGHGFFSADGALLYAVENDFNAERGVFGVYKTDHGFRRAGEVDTGGVGPHEAILLRDGALAAVANGGIATHPDYPREKLNLASMRSNIALIDLDAGRVNARFDTPHHYQKLSLRHLAELPNGDIWFGAQYEGDPTRPVPLAGRLRYGRNLELFEDQTSHFQQYRHYVGSVSASTDGSRVALTSPRGGIASIWNASDATILSTVSAPDVCGILPGADNRFDFTNGLGQILGRRSEPLSTHPVSWDNHARRVGVIAPSPSSSTKL